MAGNFRPFAVSKVGVTCKWILAKLKKADNFANKALNEERSSISDQAKSPPATTVDFAKKLYEFCM